MGFCSCASKYILFFFNLAVALLGLAVVGVCIYANIHGKSLRSFLEGQINITSIVLLSVGALVFLIAFLGCCGAIRENHCYLITYGVILSALLLAEIVVGILCFVTVPKVQDEYSKYLDQTFDDALKDNQEAVNNMYGIQSNLECCGVMDANDYTSHGKEIPASCCKDRLANNSTCSAADAYQKGCKDAGNVTIKFFLLLMGIVAVIVATVELLCVIFAFCLASSIKRNQMRGYA